MFKQLLVLACLALAQQLHVVQAADEIGVTENDGRCRSETSVSSSFFFYPFFFFLFLLPSLVLASFFFFVIGKTKLFLYTVQQI